MNLVFVDQEKNLKNVVELYNKNITKKVNKNTIPEAKIIYFLFF